MFVEQVIACLGALRGDLRRFEHVLVVVGLQPIVFYRCVERRLLVFELELIVELLQSGFVDGGGRLAIVKQRHADAHTGAEAKVVFELRSPGFVAHRGGVGIGSGIQTNGGLPHGFGYLDAQVAALNAQFGILNLGAMGHGLLIDVVELRDECQCHVVGGLGGDDFERLVVGELQQLFELAFIVFQCTLGLHHGIFILRALRRELCQIGFAHFPHVDYLLPSLLVFNACGEAFLIHFDGLGGVEDLHIELCNLLDERVGRGGRVEFGLLLGILVEFDLVAVAVAIPKHQIGAHTIAAVVECLVDAGLHAASGYHIATHFGPWRVGDVVRGVES